jgi:soluble lytic murein transglycosylase-like protein
MRKLVACLLLGAMAVTAKAEDAPLRLTAAQRAIPAQLDTAQRDAFARAFRDLDAGRVSQAKAVAASFPNGLLTPVLEAEILLAQRSTAATLADWLQKHPDLPQSPRLAERARALGAVDLPELPLMRPMRVVSFTTPMEPRRARGEAAADALAEAMRPLIDQTRLGEAEELWRTRRGDVAEPARNEWAQRLAWAYYVSGDDVAAQRMGSRAGDGRDDWAALGHWVAGLAAWRLNDCLHAAEHFDAVGLKDAPADLRAAAAYWSSRAQMACGRPENVARRLQVAAQYGDSFYGLLAIRALGLPAPNKWAEPDFIQADWNHLAKLPGARRAAALVEIGQLGLADRELKHLAATTEATYYEPLLRLAARLDMPATQYWLAHRPPAGANPPLASRFPAPAWRPYRGWRVDQSLVFAHALQESNFVTDATSRAGARGIMQLMPQTARDVCRDIGEVHDDARLADPTFNIELGQSYLEELRDSTWTQGLLPKVVAAYNAGPGTVQRWNVTLRDNGDPLLFIESIPFKETRHYVEVVLRNYWMYQQRKGEESASLDALARGLWPRFPGMPGATAVKLDSIRTTASAN